MILRDLPLYLMGTWGHGTCRSSLCGYIVVFTFLAAVSKGSACEAPSSPECFRRNASETIYTCEWSMNTSERNVTFVLYFNSTGNGETAERCWVINETWCQITEEQLIKYRPIDIWVEAQERNSRCPSAIRTVVLGDTVKYEAPQNISMSWLKNNLKLSWPAAENHPAQAEVWVRRDGHPTDSWEKRQQTTNETSMRQVVVVNLLKVSSYKVQIRQRSTVARNPLWSDWSPVVTVPAELEEKPDVTTTVVLLNGTRKVTLTWKPMPHAAAATGVTYKLEDTQSSRGCPCKKTRHPNKMNTYTIHVSHSAVNISVIARNAAGYSPPAIVQLPAEPAADLKICDKTLLYEKLDKKTCLELYELQDGDSRPEHVITLTARNKKKENMTDYVRYLYFEHRCDGGKPQTVKKCLFYQKECAPTREPQGLIAFGETESSANLSWKVIPLVHQRGFLTHYILCRVKISSQGEPKECQNISASLLKYRLENLTPGAKYNVSLAAVTQVGDGPQATVIFNTPVKPVNVWWSLGLLFLFFLISIMCTFILKRVKNKVLPPVPTPVIPDFTSYQPESQEMLERKEEVHELMLQQIHPEVKSVPLDAEETTVVGGEWDDGTDEDPESERRDSRMSGGTSDECLSPGSTHQALRSSREGEMTDLEQVDNEIAMLIYRNGLVFDVKTDSP
ncbi:interleukin-12 receptor subunit beta-1 [Pempheris klunzingeri]|uniref:interleukin-12 receptor subunit beta-1 n=1 Tax=Pempheris klunzingeri TaxID=3127111 RepID=UPI00397FDEC5